MESEEAATASLQNAPRPARMIEPAIILASSASAVSARMVTHPLDTIRIRVQTSGPTVPPLNELVGKGGIRGLYAGLPVAIGFSVPALSLYLTTYEASKRYFNERWLPRRREPTLWERLPVFVAAGTAAELASGAIWTPLDVLKSRLQKGDEGTSAVQLVRKIVREEGWKGLQRGYWVGTAIFIPNVSVFWCIYESLKTRFVPTPPSSYPSSAPLEAPHPLRYTLCSVLACAIAATTTTPIEVVQARWQTSGGKPDGGRGIRGIVKELWRQGGARAFTRGLGVRIAYAMPANAISMTVYESIKRRYGLS
ncbi:hypothetical protein JCM11641_005536 [Rhodosporidiobolus odoratus]